MVLWSDINKDVIDVVAGMKDKSKYLYDGKPLRFQIPRGVCTWGVSQYKSFNIEIKNPEFIQWWVELERRLCPQEPFKSNMSNGSLRIKIDDATYIFDENSKQVTPEVREGLFRGQELSCIIDIESNYFFNNVWGLTIRASQIRFYGTEQPIAAPSTSARRCARFGEGDLRILGLLRILFTSARLAVTRRPLRPSFISILKQN